MYARGFGGRNEKFGDIPSVRGREAFPGPPGSAEMRVDPVSPSPIDSGARTLDTQFTPDRGFSK
jgi:hypothetical protein